MPDFQAALALVLKSEGGRADVRGDPGGRTNQGVTQRVYDAYRRHKGLASRTVYDILPAEVAAIYRRQYADAIRFDDLPEGLGYAVFDAAVNSGPVRAAKWLQEALDVEADGHIGVLTLDAARACHVADIINRFCDMRMAFLRSLPTAPEFERGWANRVIFVRREALAMVAATPAPLKPVVAPPAAATVTPIARVAPDPIALPSVITPAPKPQAAKGLMSWLTGWLS